MIFHGMWVDLPINIKNRKMSHIEIGTKVFNPYAPLGFKSLNSLFPGGFWGRGYI